MLAKDLSLRLLETMQQVLQTSALMTAQPNKLCQATLYALAATGKMLRGRMLLAAYQAVTGNLETGRALPAAAAIEYLHLGTLIHDDLIDLDELRRGQASVWRQYGSETALLSGDLFYFVAFQTLVRSLGDEKIARRVLDAFSTTCVNLCLGQALEENLAGNCNACYEDYFSVVRLKTASLFRTALEVGALLGSGSEEQIQALAECAEHLGLAFQIIDDLLPFTGDPRTIGKPVTSDIKNHRLTAPILSAFTLANKSEQRTLRAIYEEKRFDTHLELAHQVITVILRRTGAYQKAEQDALQHLQNALQFLEILPNGTGREELVLMAHSLVKRNK
ncbi:MAG TPA: polyprenyl synthetase family protein [Ktedonobacteraceae bacterium]|nr:polyprenyl synthetase family protein [Ktedonobacteraceae bacterium]